MNMLFITEVVGNEDSLTFLYRTKPDGSGQHKATRRIAFLPLACISTQLITLTS